MIVSTMQDDFPLTVPMILRHAVALHADASIAWSEAGTTRRTDLATTAARSRRLSGALRALGVRPGEPVATLAWNTREHLEAYLAIPAMGAVLHTVNVRLAPDQLVHVLTEAGDRVVLVDAELLPVLVDVLPRCPRVERLVVWGTPDAAVSGVEVLDYEELLAAAEPWTGEVADERAPAAMCHTSGTTGPPKGVVYSHRSVYLHAAANLYAGGFGLHDADTVLQVVPMFHANGWGFPYAALLAGAGLVLPGRDLSPEALVRLIAAERPTVSGGVPTIWRGVLDRARETGADLTSLRVVSCAGSAVPTTLVEDWVGLGVELYQAWGMTETSPLAAIARPPARRRGRAASYWRGRTGRPVPGVEVRAVDEHDVELARDGASAGELEVRGPWVTGRYLGDVGGDRFHDGWLRTGDVGTIDPAGALTITDRAKDLIKSGGEWISSVAVEDLLSAVPGVVEAACIGVPDDRWGERPLAVVLLRAGATVSLAAVHDHLARALARWQLPERVLAVDAIPRTGVGKIDKVELRRRHASGELTGLPLA